MTPATKIAEFVSRSSHLHNLDTYPLGTLSGFFNSSVELSAVVVTDVQSKTVVKGLRVEVSQTQPIERSVTAWCDEEELLDLASALGYFFSETQKPWNPARYEGAGTARMDSYRVLNYSTRGWLRLAVSPNRGVVNAGALTFTVNAGIVAPALSVSGIVNIAQMKAMVDTALRILRQ